MAIISVSVDISIWFDIKGMANFSNSIDTISKTNR